MFRFYADKNKLSLKESEVMTSGSVNVYLARFEFSSDWEDLDRVAVFRGGNSTVSIPLSDDNECMIPWTLLTVPQTLFAGVYGSKGNEIVLPTQWVKIGSVIEGVVLGPDAIPEPDETGRTNHGLLYNRDGADQHPIDAISGLAKELQKIPPPTEAISNKELEGLLE